MDRQHIEVDGNKIILHNQLNIDTELQAIKDERDLSDNGFTQERTMRKIGSIPLYAFRSDPLLKEALQAQQAGDKETYSRCVKLWLNLNREWSTARGKF
jgi:hypothetical protein